MDTLALLKTYSEASGPSGREALIRDIIHEQWAPLVDDLRTDAMGNLIALQRGSAEGTRPAVMGAAHMDEIGLIVTKLEGEFLNVHALGGIDRRVLLGTEVIVHGKETLTGIIGTRPPHVLPMADRKKTVPWERLFVDVGLPAAEVKARVQVGDHITIKQDLSELQNGLVAGKALDNRASLVSLTQALEKLRHRDHAWDFYAVATVQEEVGIKGAITSAYGINPQIAIAIDATFGKQHNDGAVGAFELGKGPTLGIGPNFHPQIFEALEKAATSEEIPFQIEPLSGSSGTDAWGIQVAREGIPCGLLSIPLRYMHQPVETIDLNDIERTGRLLANFVAQLASDFRPCWEDERE